MTYGNPLLGYVNMLVLWNLHPNLLKRILQDFSNPEVAKHLQFYPEETDGPISEVWQAERWKEFGPSERTPMYAHGLKQFFIDEVAQLETASFVLPLSWIKRNGHLCADCLDVTVCPTYFLSEISADRL